MTHNDNHPAHRTARIIRQRTASRANHPAHLAVQDQALADIREAWNNRGINLNNPSHAATVFGTLSWAFSVLIVTLEDQPDPAAATTTYGDHLLTAITAIAEFVK